MDWSRRHRRLPIRMRKRSIRADGVIRGGSPEGANLPVPDGQLERNENPFSLPQRPTFFPKYTTESLFHLSTKFTILHGRFLSVFESGMRAGFHHSIILCASNRKSQPLGYPFNSEPFPSQDINPPPLPFIYSHHDPL